jgi:hypothetical protein
VAATELSERRDALVERLFGATLGAMDVLSVYLGVRLGLYHALADRGSSSSKELAEATGLDERYVREWLEQQATTGILDLEDDGRFKLPAGHDEALLDETSLNYVAPFGKLVVACVRPIDQLLAAYRSGDGVPYAEYGDDLHEGQAEFTRPIFDNFLGTNGSRASRMCTSGSRPILPPGWPTSPAARATRRWPSRARIRRRSSTGSTSTRRRSPRRRRTSPGAGSRSA